MNAKPLGYGFVWMGGSFRRPIFVRDSGGWWLNVGPFAFRWKWSW